MAYTWDSLRGSCLDLPGLFAIPGLKVPHDSEIFFVYMFSFSGEKFLDLLARLVCFLGICVGGMSSIAPNKGISSQEENIIPKCLLLQSLCFPEQGPTDFDTGARKKKFANLIYKLALAGIRFWCAWVLAWTCSPTVSLECRSSGRNKRFGQCRSPARCRPRVNGKTLKFLISSCYFW